MEPMGRERGSSGSGPSRGGLARSVCGLYRGQALSRPSPNQTSTTPHPNLRHNIQPLRALQAPPHAL